MIRFSARTLLVLAPMAALLNCGGGSSGSPAPATKASTLHYTAPTVPPGSTAYHVEVASGQDTSKLVLALVGPEGAQTAGVTFYLTADSTKAKWTSAGGTYDSYANNGTTFTMTSPCLLKSKQSGNNLQVGLFQKGLSSPVTLASNNTLATVALQLQSNIDKGSISFSTTSGKQAKSMASDGTMNPINVLVGTLTAN